MPKINLLKLVELSEQCAAGKSEVTVRAVVRKAFGLNETGDAWVPATREFDAKEVSLQEVANAFFGRGYQNADFPQHMAAFSAARPLIEAGVVLPSHFANINAFVDTVAGLVDAQIMEAYASPEFIGKSIVAVRDTRVNGGSMIGVRNDGQDVPDLIPGEELPSVGLKETFVALPKNKRYGRKLEIDQHVFLYDRTDQVSDAAQKIGYAVGRDVEIAIARTVLGIDNTYKLNGVTGNTYLTAAGTAPMDYINQETNALVDWTDIDQARVKLATNKDYSTGYEISVPTPTLLVMPQRELRAQAIIRATEIYSQKGSVVDTNLPNTITKHSNPISGVSMKAAPMLWYNQLVLAAASGGGGVSAANAADRWMLGDFKKAFRWLQLFPFRSTTGTLSAYEQARGIVLVQLAEESGAIAVADPRYAYRGTLE